MSLLLVFLALIFIYSLVSGRLAKTVVTAPIVFTAAGILTFFAIPALSNRRYSPELYLQVAEAGLVLLLFADASRTGLRFLRSIYSLPTRLLSIGMLLTLLLGVLAARLVFPDLSFWEAGILAAILAPTDAGLGQIIVNSPNVPMKIRQGLNVEAGLNDGLSVPFLLFFIALCDSGSGSHDTRLAQFILEQLGYGTLIGVGLGWFGGGWLGLAYNRKWIDHSWTQLGVVTLPLLCMLVSEMAGASMFIAAFAAGLAVQFGFKEAGAHSVEFTEQWGQMLNLFVFFLFGFMVARAGNQFNGAHLLYAILSLTVVRMAPVALALLGMGFSKTTLLFIGWFGPRGLASIVLGLFYLEETSHRAAETTIRLAVMVTVALSIFAHGLSALPGMKLYARKIKDLPPGAPELEEAELTSMPSSPLTPHLN